MADTGLHVTDIKQTVGTEPDGNGGYHKAYTVHFTTPSGTRTHITLPASHYSPANAAAAIAHEAAQVEGVHALEGLSLLKADA